MDDETKAAVTSLMAEKIDDWRAKVEGIELEDLRLNIFLAAAMDMDEPRELIQWGVHQHLERSIVTSFGFLIEKIALEIADGEKHKGEGGDIVVERGGETYYVEIKGGTASSNVKMMRNTSNAQATIKDEYGDVQTVLGLTYGKQDEVFSTMQSYYQGDELLVGKGFWEFLSGEENTHKAIIDAIKRAQDETFETDDGASSLQELMEEKIDELTAVWEREYGDSLSYDMMIERFF